MQTAHLEWTGLRYQNSALLTRENSAQRVLVPETPPFYFRKLQHRSLKKPTTFGDKATSPWAWGRDPNSLSLKNTLLLRDSSQFITAPSPHTLPVMSTTAESLSKQEEIKTPNIRPTVRKSYPDSGPLLGQSSFRKLGPKKQLRVPRPDFFRCPSKSEAADDPSVEAQATNVQREKRTVGPVRHARSASRIRGDDDSYSLNQIPETFQVTEVVLDEPVRTAQQMRPLNVSDLLSQDLSGGKRIRFRFEDFRKQVAGRQGLDVSAKSDGLILTPKSALKSSHSRLLGSFSSQRQQGQWTPGPGARKKKVEFSKNKMVLLFNPET